MGKEARREIFISTDTKNRPFLGRFGRKMALHMKENDILFCVFVVFWGFFPLQAFV
jgi:hypothetical protein